ncbi:hypothetical protein NWP17_08195 [Chrysosporum bergii ANA360D]|uniref:Uncharacterized protein n=1 Tax=Chrysosporum bergii ANA360D TaxID=617107 RepID=A0AA43KBC9_9CYAN|nr:hypothetical protein [Chrysosporum bergii]MDH6060416.1 hypothetical protein [Chrysosporum bergii ANA360D]
MSWHRLKAPSLAEQTHRMNIHKSLEHRLEVAKAKNDQQLIHQLEAEMKYFS